MHFRSYAASRRIQRFPIFLLLRAAAWLTCGLGLPRVAAAQSYDAAADASSDRSDGATADARGDDANRDATGSDREGSELQPTEPTAEVVVSARIPLLLSSPRGASGASTVLTQAQLERAGDSAADVLRQVAGVQLNRTGSKAEPATASIRGADAKQTPVYLAGVLLNDDVNGSADLSTIPLWMMQRAEVFRGNAPASSEQLGIGGAIFFEPRRPQDTRMGVASQVGSFGERGASLNGEVGSSNASALVSMRATRADNDYPFTNDHGLRFTAAETSERRRNADYSDVDGWAIGSARLGPARLGSIVHVLDREQGTTGVATTPARSARSHNRRLLAAIHGSLPCSDSWTCKLEAQSSLLVGMETVTDPNNELRTVHSEWHHTRALRHSHRFQAKLQLSRALQLTPYITASHDTLSLQSADDAPRRAARTSARAGLEVQVTASPDVDLFAMLGAACYGTDAEYRDVGRWQHEDRAECPATPDARLGAVWYTSDTLSVVSNVSHTTREPTLGELYGTSASLQGEPELRAEVGYSADVGVRGEKGWSAIQVGWDAFVFRRWTTDLVRYRQTSLYAFSPYNVGQAEVTGAELTIATRWFDTLETHHSATVLDPRETTKDRVANSTANDVLPLLSRLVTYHEVAWSQAFLASNIRRLTAALRYSYRSNRFADPAGLAVLPQQHLVDGEVRLHLQDPDLCLSLSLNNLFNERQIDVLGQPLPGRSYLAELEYWW